MMPYKIENLTKWATADVPVRITRTVVTVPVERPGIRTVVHVTARDHQPRAVTLPVFNFLYWQQAPSSLRLPVFQLCCR